MTRYLIVPRSAPDGHWNDPLLPHLDVPEHKPVDTGLVDHRGDKIIRAPRPVGFHLPRTQA